jgi:flagellar basal body rod protein FlgG
MMTIAATSSVTTRSGSFRMDKCGVLLTANGRKAMSAHEPSISNPSKSNHQK